MAEDYNDNNKRVGPTSYKTQYPHNRVEQIGGHLIEFDTTPGAERIKIAHASGSHMEIQKDGKMTMYTVGNKEDYTKGGMSCTVDENGDVKICGHNRQNSDGGNHSTCKGDSDCIMGGHSTITVVGNAKVAVAGDAYMGVKGDMNMNIGKNVSMKVAGDMTMETKGTHTIKASLITMNP